MAEKEKNISIPISFLHKVLDLLEEIEDFELTPEAKENAKIIWDMLFEKAEKMKSRKEYIENGGTFKNERT